MLKFSFSSNENFKSSFKSVMNAILNIKVSACDRVDSSRSSLICSYVFQVNRVAELLARYVDRKLRGEKGMQETDTEMSFDKVSRGYARPQFTLSHSV